MIPLFILLFVQEMTVAHGLMIHRSVAQGICLQQELFISSPTRAGQIRKPLKTSPYPLNLKIPKCAWMKLDKGETGSAPPTVTEMSCDQLGLGQGVSTSDASYARIINGTEIVPDSYPSYVRIQAASKIDPSNFASACGATIIDANWAITAKHCGQDEDGEFTLRIISGRQNEDDEEEGEQIRLIDRKIYHPDNNTDDPIGKYIDLLLLHWEEPLTFGKKAQPAPFVTEAKEAGDLTLVGVGLQADGCSPCEIREVTVPIITDEKCNRAVSNGTLDLERWVICTQTPQKAGCYGDSGGPMYAVDAETGSQSLAGVISFVNSESSGGIACFKPDVLSAGMEVYWFQDWIQQNLNA